MSCHVILCHSMLSYVTNTTVQQNVLCHEELSAEAGSRSLARRRKTMQWDMWGTNMQIIMSMYIYITICIYHKSRCKWITIYTRCKWIIIYINYVCILYPNDLTCAGTFFWKASLMIWICLFLWFRYDTSVKVLEDLCCVGRYPEGDALTLNAPWHADDYN